MSYTSNIKNKALGVANTFKNNALGVTNTLISKYALVNKIKVI